MDKKTTNVYETTNYRKFKKSYGDWPVCMNPDSGRMYQAVGFGDTCAEWYEYTEVNDDED